MSVRVRMKIKEGVERGLCGTCRNAIIRTDLAGEQEVWCEAAFQNPMLIRKPIGDCSHHDFKFIMQKYEMEQKAWILEVKKGKIVGFVRPEDRKDKD